jgi:hypothetical protein
MNLLEYELSLRWRRPSRIEPPTVGCASLLHPNLQNDALTVWIGGGPTGFKDLYESAANEREAERGKRSGRGLGGFLYSESLESGRCWTFFDLHVLCFENATV